jgi:hypothetical protein
MNGLSYDIFCGLSANNATWIEAHNGLDQAYSRMEQLAAEKPGSYFLFSQAERRMLILIDTTAVILARASGKSKVA